LELRVRVVEVYDVGKGGPVLRVQGQAREDEVAHLGRDVDVEEIRPYYCRVD